MKVQIVSVDPNRPVQIGAEQFGYWGSFRSPLISGEAILFSIGDGLKGLVKGRTIEVQAEVGLLRDSVSNFKLVPSFETPRIECLSEPGDYAVFGTAMDVQSYFQVGDLLFELSGDSMAGIVPREGQRVSFTIDSLLLVDTTCSTKLIKSFGPFSNVFLRDDGVRVAAHLSLLNLYTDPTTALDLVGKALQTGDWESYAVKMLQYPNWMFHVVAGCALLFAPSQRVLHALWQAIDAGSWASPQLAVAGYFADPDFIEQAKSRVEAGCPVILPEGLDASEIYNMTVSGNELRQSAKNLATLLYLCGQLPVLSSWHQEMQTSPKVVAHLKKDIDGSAAITERWLKGITHLFKDRGTALSPAYRRQL